MSDQHYGYGTLSLKQALDVITLFGEWCDSLLWLPNHNPAKRFPVIAIDCSDAFYENADDVEEIAAEDIPALRQAHQDCVGSKAFMILFVARKREMRPREGWYYHIESNLWPLFDAVGPPRGPDINNPVSRLRRLLGECQQDDLAVLLDPHRDDEEKAP